MLNSNLSKPSVLSLRPVVQPVVPATINMPQSMTVFNLKEISSKLKNFKAVPQTSSPTVSFIINVLTNKETSKQSETFIEDSKPTSHNNPIQQTTKSTESQSIDMTQPQFKITTTSPVPIHSESVHSSLPYHFSEYENLYICNLCNCTYDSLRSIKAHLWKHSGHRELSYPIHDYDNNKQSSNKTQQTTKLFQLEPGYSSGSLASPGSGSNQQAGGGKGGGGICSALLEVIEKLRDEEESTGESSGSSRSSIKRKRLVKKKRVDKENANGSEKNLDDCQECRIETSVVNSLLDDDYGMELLPQIDKMLEVESVQVKKKNNPKSKITNRKVRNKKQIILEDNEVCPKQVVDKQLIQVKYPSLSTVPTSKHDLLSLLTSLATNDGHEQYVCALCSYVCRHLPSLKSHMWTHVKSPQFDYSVNTSIINAALDYENKLTRKLTAIARSDSSGFVERQLMAAVELTSYPPQTLVKLTCNESMVAFRCSKCGFETIDLSMLRIHKREHSESITQ